MAGALVLFDLLLSIDNSLLFMIFDDRTQRAGTTLDNWNIWYDLISQGGTCM